MNDKQLEYAIALSKSLNFSHVAEKYGISQPALSKQIHALEKELGIELFNRKQSPIVLTAAGKYFFREASELVYKEEQLIKSLDGFKCGDKGVLNIGVSPFRALYLLPELCKKIREEFPDITITLHEDTSDILRAKAAEGKFDFAIVNLPVNEAILDAIPIEEDMLVLAIPTKFLPRLDIPAPAPMSEIDFKICKDIPFVVIREAQEMRTLFDKICLVAELKPTIAMEVVGLATAWSMATKGIGATLLPLQFIKAMGNSSDLTLFIPKCDSRIRRPSVVTRRGQYISPHARYAIDILTNSML
ncbi:MAG: LysR family transcriptional regulator [Clostridia bacterium]|nr:LysR family transcriptional regulator [Clostridia bacterium]